MQSVLTRVGRRLQVAAAVFCLVALSACVESNNRAPILSAVPDLRFVAGQSNTAQLSARDPDGDELSFRYEFSPIPESLGRVDTQEPELLAVTQGVILSWRPSENDASGVSDGVYVMTIIADDGRGGEARVSLRLTVVAMDGGSNDQLRFVEPHGDGIFTESDCLPNIPVKVTGGAPSERVTTRVMMTDSDLCATAGYEGCPVLEVDDLGGRNATVQWCPTREQLEVNDHQPILFEAQLDGADLRATKPYFARFGATPHTVCSASHVRVAEPPRIEQINVDSLVFRASFDGVDVLDRPPLLLYEFYTGSQENGRESWLAARFERAEDGQWDARVWLPEPLEAYTHLATRAYVSQELFAEGQNCLSAFMGDWQTLRLDRLNFAGGSVGHCGRCEEQASCAPGFACVPLGGDSYCLAACTEDGDCESQASCRQLEVAPDVSPNVCVPHTLNCGQICLPDALDEAEEGVGESVTLLTEWSYDALTACVGDVDRYRFRLSANDGLLVRVQATGRAGYLDLEHIVEDGGTPQMTQSQSNGTEELFFACSDEVRDVEFQIRSLNGTDVTYDLDLELANERCAQACIPDRFEGDPESDLLELPFLEALTICRDDVDRLSFFVEEGRTYRVEFQGPDGRPQLKYRVDLDERLAEWRRADIQPIYEFGAPRSTTVELVIEAQGLEHVGAYEVAVRESVLGDVTMGPPVARGSVASTVSV